MKEMKYWVVLTVSVILGGAYLLNIDNCMIYLEAVLAAGSEFIATHRELLDRFCNTGLLVIAVAIVITLVKDFFVFMYESLQDEDSVVFIILFVIACIVTFIPFQVYKVCRRAVRKSKQRKSRG